MVVLDLQVCHGSIGERCVAWSVALRALEPQAPAADCPVPDASHPACCVLCPAASTTTTTPQAGPLNFYDMGEDQRKQWLDDGLHFTEHGYDQLASHIANAITTNFATTR